MVQMSFRQSFTDVLNIKKTEEYSMISEKIATILVEFDKSFDKKWET